MNDLEMAQTLFLRLSESEQKKVVKRAVEEGFTVDGFSKNVQNAPIKSICGCMSKKVRKGKYYYKIILETMADQLRVDTDNVWFKLASEWIENDGHEKVEEKLKELLKIESNGREEVSKVELNINEDETNNGVDNSNEKIKKLEEELLSAREKNKKNKLVFQENKIEIDNLKKIIERQEKDKKKLAKQIEELQEQLEIIEKDKLAEIKKNEETKGQVVALEEQIKGLLGKIVELEQYKKNAPKILCIAITKGHIEVPGYDIKLVNMWNEEIKEEAMRGDYMEIWLVQKQFPYNVVGEISECIGKKLKKFLTIENLMSAVKLGGN